MKSVIYILGVFFMVPAFAHLNPPKFISLVPPNNNLENENLIENLCPKTTKDLEKCRKDSLSSKSWYLKVYDRPDLGAKQLGLLQIIGTPGKGMTAEWVENSKPAVKFEPASKDTDWGYSCFFQFTVSGVKGDWIQLPKRPFNNPVWINIKKDWPLNGKDGIVPEPTALEIGNIYSAGAIGNIVPIQFSGSELIYRKENKNDMSCGDEVKKIPPEELKELKTPISNLYDKDGHLIAWPAYCRGC